KLTRLPTFPDHIQSTAEKAGPRMRLMIEFAWRTGARQTDIRMLQVQQIRAALEITQSKTQMQQDWEITPELKALPAAAEKLPGRARSMFVFPQRNGQPLGEGIRLRVGAPQGGISVSRDQDVGDQSKDQSRRKCDRLCGALRFTHDAPALRSDREEGE